LLSGSQEQKRVRKSAKIVNHGASKKGIRGKKKRKIMKLTKKKEAAPAQTGTDTV